MSRKKGEIIQEPTAKQYIQTQTFSIIFNFIMILGEGVKVMMLK